MEITESAISNMSGKRSIADDIQNDEIQVTRWSLDSSSFGAYSVSPPRDWYQREILAEPLKDETEAERVFFAGEATAPLIYIGSYAGAYESAVKAACDIDVAMAEAAEKANEAGSSGSTGIQNWAARSQPAELWACGNEH